LVVELTSAGCTDGLLVWFGGLLGKYPAELRMLVCIGLSPFSAGPPARSFVGRSLLHRITLGGRTASMASGTAAVGVELQG
jgi:hypothetical protein